jgi:hypothetical protein
MSQTICASNPEARLLLYTSGRVEPEIHRVGPEFPSWPSSLNETPCKSLTIGLKCGPTLWIVRPGVPLRPGLRLRTASPRGSIFPPVM